jgi:hypothetical protein
VITYSQLKADIRSWLARPDLTDAEVDGFIRIALSRVNRRLRIGGMETIAPLTLNAKVVALPSDFAGLRAIRLDDSELRYVTPEHLDDMDAVSGLPGSFSIVGGSIVLDRSPDTAYTATITYFARFPMLSDSVTTNWLTDNAPDLLLWGALCAAGKYIRDAEIMSMYSAKFDEAMFEVSQADESDKFGPAPVMKQEGWMP